MENTFFIKYNIASRNNNFKNILSLDCCEHLRGMNSLITDFILLGILTDLLNPHNLRPDHLPYYDPYDKTILN